MLFNKTFVLVISFLQHPQSTRNKNHIGFIADEIERVIPEEFENVVSENDKGIKMLNYVKLNTLLWGCVQQQQKIEHLENRLFEIENFIEDFVKPKAKAKSKSTN